VSFLVGEEDLPHIGRLAAASAPRLAAGAGRLWRGCHNLLYTAKMSHSWPREVYTLPALRETALGVLIKVRASPGASRERIAGVHGEALKVAVQAPPEKGKANEAIALAISRSLALRASQVKIHSGESSRDKWFHVEGLSLNEVKERLTGLLQTQP